jgi:hypothetical protein
MESTLVFTSNFIKYGVNHARIIMDKISYQNDKKRDFSETANKFCLPFYKW